MEIYRKVLNRCWSNVESAFQRAGKIDKIVIVFVLNLRCIANRNKLLEFK